MRYSCRILVSILAVSTLYLSGCDSQSTDDSILLSHTFTTDTNLDPIRFTFSSDDVTPGSPVELSCNCLLDIKPFLDSRSFSKSEILSASVTAARIKIFFPIGERLDFLNNAELVLKASGAPASLIAEDDTFPASQEIALSVVPGVPVVAHMKASSTTPFLTIDTGSLTPGTVYEVGVEFAVELEMKGF